MGEKCNPVSFWSAPEWCNFTINMNSLHKWKSVDPNQLASSDTCTYSAIFEPGIGFFGKSQAHKIYLLGLIQQVNLFNDCIKVLTVLCTQRGDDIIGLCVHIMQLLTFGLFHSNGRGGLRLKKMELSSASNSGSSNRQPSSLHFFTIWS